MTAVADIVSYAKPSLRSRIGKPLAWAFLILLMAITLLPFFWALRTALNTNSALLSGDQSLFPEYTNVNFERVLDLATPEEIQEATGRPNSPELSFPLALRNSIIIASIIAVGQVFFSALAAYAFARLKFRGREPLFTLYLTGLMIPPIIVLIPNLILMKELGWLNTFQGIIAPFLLMSPFSVFFLRQFFLGINREIEGAALIDGAGHFRIFWSIILPIARPQMITLGVLTYVTAWNEYLWPLTVAPVNENVQPLTLALGQFTRQQPGTSPDWSALMAGTLLSALPVIVIFIIFGRRIVDSIRFTGIK